MKPSQSDIQKVYLEFGRASELTIDQIAVSTKIEARQAEATVLEMERQGLVSNVGEKWITRTEHQRRVCMNGWEESGAKIDHLIFEMQRILNMGQNARPGEVYEILRNAIRSAGGTPL